MNLEGRITILISKDRTIIEIEDDNASMRFVTVTLSPEQLSACLSRQVCVECKLEVVGLDKVGKKHENSSFVFVIPKELRGSEHHEKLREIAQDLLDKQGDGWISENYFASQGTFFEKDGLIYAKCTIRRWI